MNVYVVLDQHGAPVHVDRDSESAQAFADKRNLEDGITAYYVTRVMVEVEACGIIETKSWLMGAKEPSGATEGNYSTYRVL